MCVVLHLSLCPRPRIFFCVQTFWYRGLPSAISERQAMTQRDRGASTRRLISPRTLCDSTIATGTRCHLWVFVSPCSGCRLALAVYVKGLCAYWHEIQIWTPVDTQKIKEKSEAHTIIWTAVYTQKMVTHDLHTCTMYKFTGKKNEINVPIAFWLCFRDKHKFTVSASVSLRAILLISGLFRCRICSEADGKGRSGPLYHFSFGA